MKRYYLTGAADAADAAAVWLKLFMYTRNASRF